MRKLRIAIQKEWWILLNDKIGLLLLFGMPILMVFIITMVQNSSYEMAKSNRFHLRVVNGDKGFYGDSLIRLLKETNAFDIRVEKMNQNNQVSKQLSGENELLLVQIPVNFSQSVGDKGKRIASEIVAEMGMGSSTAQNQPKQHSKLYIFYNPILQENYRRSIENSFTAFVAKLESKAIMNAVFKQVGITDQSPSLRAALQENSSIVSMKPSGIHQFTKIPNATQHNVPAWTLFALFFMVVSLGTNLVRERESASYIRLQLIPNSFRLVIWSKVIVYFGVATAQILVLFLAGVYLFPLLSLPPLFMPASLLPLILVSIGSAGCAIAYAVVVGTFSKTVEQSNGFGAISILVFAAIGGVWVPNFVLPDYLKVIGKLSPLQWCINGYYQVFLEEANLTNLIGLFCYFIGFIVISMLLISWKLKRMKSMK